MTKSSCVWLKFLKRTLILKQDNLLDFRITFSCQNPVLSPVVETKLVTNLANLSWMPAFILSSSDCLSISLDKGWFCQINSRRRLLKKSYWILENMSLVRANRISQNVCMYFFFSYFLAFFCFSSSCCLAFHSVEVNMSLFDSGPEPPMRKMNEICIAWQLSNISCADPVIAITSSLSRMKLFVWWGAFFHWRQVDPSEAASS